MVSLLMASVRVLRMGVRRRRVVAMRRTLRAMESPKFGASDKWRSMTPMWCISPTYVAFYHPRFSPLQLP